MHSAKSVEDGGWQVKGNYLVHEGPDNQKELYATVGCVEVMGKQGLRHFNPLSAELSGAPGKSIDEKLKAYGRSRRMTIQYLRAAKPPLIPMARPTS